VQLKRSLPSFGALAGKPRMEEMVADKIGLSTSLSGFLGMTFVTPSERSRSWVTHR
jgi:hypothetical protein